MTYLLKTLFAVVIMFNMCLYVTWRWGNLYIHYYFTRQCECFKWRLRKTAHFVVQEYIYIIKSTSCIQILRTSCMKHQTSKLLKTGCCLVRRTNKRTNFPRAHHIYKYYNYYNKYIILYMLMLCVFILILIPGNDCNRVDAKW